MTFTLIGECSLKVDGEQLAQATLIGRVSDELSTERACSIAIPLDTALYMSSASKGRAIVQACVLELEDACDIEAPCTFLGDIITEFKSLFGVEPSGRPPLPPKMFRDSADPGLYPAKEEANDDE